MSDNIDLMKDCQRFVAMTPEELTQLDRECAEALGYVLEKRQGVNFWINHNEEFFTSGLPTPICSELMFQPTTDKSQWAELLERFNLTVGPCTTAPDTMKQAKGYVYKEGKFIKEVCERGDAYGIAIVRAVIAAHSGSDV